VGRFSPTPASPQNALAGHLVPLAAVLKFAPPALGREILGGSIQLLFQIIKRLYWILKCA